MVGKKYEQIGSMMKTLNNRYKRRLHGKKKGTGVKILVGDYRERQKGKHKELGSKFKMEELLVNKPGVGSS